MSDTWWWSDETYRIFGFAPAQVVPTTGLLLRHLHPEDVDSALEGCRQQLAQREPFSLWHRVVDAQRKVRQVLTLGEGVWNEDGECTEVQGSFLDVTRALRISYSQDVDQAVRSAAVTRGAIEQAKGVLMLSHRVTSEQAFEALRRCSQATNVKVRDLAGSVMDTVVETGELPSALRQHLDEVIANADRRRVIPASLADGVDGSYDGVDGTLPGVDGTLDGVDGVDGPLDGVDGLDGASRRADGHGQDADPVG